jgi:hypothetical protein
MVEPLTQVHVLRAANSQVFHAHYPSSNASSKHESPTNHFGSAGLSSSLIFDSVAFAAIGDPATLASPFLASEGNSSSLSPKLKGSWSPIGVGSTVDNGCHLPDLVADVVLAAAPADIPPGAGPSRPDAPEAALLNKSGFASGRGGFEGASDAC